MGQADREIKDDSAVESLADWVGGDYAQQKGSQKQQLVWGKVLLQNCSVEKCWLGTQMRPAQK